MKSQTRFFRQFPGFKLILKTNRSSTLLRYLLYILHLISVVVKFGAIKSKTLFLLFWSPKFEPACPIQMEFFISTHVPTSTWHVTFCLADRAKQTTTKVLNVKFMYFNFFRKENDTKIPISSNHYKIN